MKVIVVFKDYTDHSREVLDWLRDFKTRTGHDLETIDPETREGEAFCRAYDIVEYPSVIATTDDGIRQQLWRGTPMPQISEVSYYTRNY
jgi:hypothetical protein